MSVCVCIGLKNKKFEYTGIQSAQVLSQEVTLSQGFRKSHNEWIKYVI